MKKLTKKLILTFSLVFALVGCKTSNKKSDVQNNFENEIPIKTEEGLNNQNNEIKDKNNKSLENKKNNKDNITIYNAIKVFNNKYPKAKIDELEFKYDNNAYLYIIKGFDNSKEYEMGINSKDGTVVIDKSENDNTSNNKSIDLNLIKDIKPIIDDTLKDAGKGYNIKSYSVEYDDYKTFHKLEIELENISGKDIEYEYNLNTKKLIKKD